MISKLKQAVVAGLLSVTALPVIAEDLALVIGNRSYDALARVKAADLTRSSVLALKTAGFRVFQGQDLDQPELLGLASEFYQALSDADHVIIFLAGHMVSNQRDSWLLATNARAPDMFTVGSAGLSIGAVLDAAGQKPGAAVVMLAHDGAPTQGFGLTAGLRDLEIPQGVTVVKGPVADLAALLTQGVLNPDSSVQAVLGSASQRVTTDGFLSENTPFLSAEPANVTPIVPLAFDDADQSYWQAVQDIGTVEALQGYVDRYPSGQFILLAQQAITTLQAQPEIQARRTEAALNLNREQRRQIQRNLSILGFNPRGIDGVFGRGSRAAIGAWQQSRGIDGFGYLTGNQIAALQSSANIRSQELEEEARQRQAEHDRLDATYWRQTGRDGTEASLHAYLKRYPDGLYSEIAQVQIDQFDAARHAQAAVVEREYWDDVQAAGSAAAYRQYLQKYPSGAFVRIAKERLEQLDGTARDKELIRRARTDEARVAGTGIARLLVEQKLQGLGLKPGRVDGTFDDKTRRAVRKFQRSRQIPVTGYVTQQTIVRLLAAR